MIRAGGVAVALLPTVGVGAGFVAQGGAQSRGSWTPRPVAERWLPGFRR